MICLSVVFVAYFWLATPQVEAKQPTTKIILVRHGQTDYNLTGRYQGSLDIPLNATGVKQAENLADFLKNVKIDVVITSPLQRAYITGEKVADTHNLPIITDNRLKEIDFGDWAGQFKKDIKANEPEAYQKWMMTPQYFKMPNGERLVDVRTRGRQAVDEIVARYPGKTILIAAHSLFNQVLIADLIDWSQTHFWQMDQDNTNISVLEYTDGQWNLSLYNCIVHNNMLAKGIELH